jgi:AcrR family transcriptional regulator
MAQVIDGRTARAQRTRQAVVDSLLELVREGDVRPTAPRIAGRAGVSLRSVFQHFPDRETLLMAAGQRQEDEILEMVQRLPTEGSLEERIESFVAQRCRVLEAVSPVRRASLAHETNSPALRASRDRIMQSARQEVAKVFAPELDGLSTSDKRELLDALDAVTQWGMWEQLRSYQGLSAKRAQRTMARTLSGLMRDSSG